MGGGIGCVSSRIGSLSGPQKFSVKETNTYLRQNYSRFARPLIGLGAPQAKHICYSHLVCGGTKCVSVCVCKYSSGGTNVYISPFCTHCQGQFFIRNFLHSPKSVGEVHRGIVNSSRKDKRVTKKDVLSSLWRLLLCGFI